MRVPHADGCLSIGCACYVGVYLQATSQEAWKAVRVSTRGMAKIKEKTSKIAGGTGIAAVAKLAMLRAAHSHSKGHLLEGKAHSAAEETHAGSIPRSGE